MNALALCVVAAMVAAATAEPPSGYSYNRPSGGGGFIGGGGGGFIGGGGGGGYISVSPGYTTSEGATVDAELLGKIRAILLREEQQRGGGGGGYVGGGGHGGVSTAYGVPSTSYGVPGYVSQRVVGIDLEGIRQAIQVAQYEQTTYGHGGGGGYSYPSSSYGAPY
ncbi:shematrin-like protein 2 [Schistocerca gregaria]|uniref:shematrin-like protein 2 n=1 Tax=Schistocerca gregaria TaxID=7010 RepID=UPI00211EF1CF|nr:shematrin-like protein 2 [Schistocerca gregaria]